MCLHRAHSFVELHPQTGPDSHSFLWTSCQLEKITRQNWPFAIVVEGISRTFGGSSLVLPMRKVRLVEWKCGMMGGSKVDTYSHINHINHVQNIMLKGVCCIISIKYIHKLKDTPLMPHQDQSLGSQTSKKPHITADAPNLHWYILNWPWSFDQVQTHRTSRLNTFGSTAFWCFAPELVHQQGSIWCKFVDLPCCYHMKSWEVYKQISVVLS